jgi:methylated-DNA-protein-cysteine methyltransferase-like protein
MAKSSAYARIKSDVLAIVAALPPGRLASAADVGRQIDVPARHVAYILTTLHEDERAMTPWWRVVADGGAIGRHKRREDQIAGLRRDGVTVSAAGVVADFAARRVTVFEAAPSGVTRRPDATNEPGKGSSAAPRRARGSKGAPKSSV